ncbi:arsinothricin resistance N-acetyltransferase ArsN1 family B [Luteitalea sp.]
MTDVTIRLAVEADAAAIAAIYAHYVRETTITFEEDVVTPDDMGARMAAVAAAGLPWLVVSRGPDVYGYAYATPWRARTAYRFSVETTVYLAHDAVGRGLGTRVYTDLLTRLTDLGLHVALGGIALPNAASVALHESCGFRKVAHLSEVGFKFGRWVDVGYWQRALT